MQLSQMIKDICDMSEIGEFKDHIRGLIPDVARVLKGKNLTNLSNGLNLEPKE
jgi:hypothetical protein